MFEDFKDKIRQHEDEKPEPSSLSPEVLAKLRSEGLDPETVTMKQLFPETLDADGDDLSLMPGAEMEILIIYAKTRKYLLEHYPQSREEANMLGHPWDEELEKPCQINIAKARDDPKSKIFTKALFQLKTIYNKVEVVQQNASSSHAKLNGSNTTIPALCRHALGVD